MRAVVVTLVSSCALLACHGDRLVGPDAQAAVRVALKDGSRLQLPADVLLVVDGVVQSDPAALEIRPEQVSTVEIIKGSTPVRVVITTKTAPIAR